MDVERKDVDQAERKPAFVRPELVKHASLMDETSFQPLSVDPGS